MTKQEAIDKHRKMWRWLSENPLAVKEDYPDLDPSIYSDNNCYLCHYGHSYDSDCTCPVDWGYKETPVSVPCVRGLFGKWLQEDSNYIDSGQFTNRILPSGRAIIARKISELTENKGEI